MSKSKKKFYVVWRGYEPGVYDNWRDCQRQVKGYPNAQYKSFDSLQLAEEAAMEIPTNRPNRHQKSRNISPHSTTSQIITPSISVDAACSGNPGIMEYQGVWTESADKVIFRQGPYLDGTNNIGEFLAIVHALALIEKNGWHAYPIYTDSITAMAWVRNKKVNTKLQKTAQNQDLFDLIERGVKWLENHTYNSSILKWETRKWGEIPADFGRK